MIEQSLVTLLLVIVTGVISYKGFNNSLFQEAYAFDVDRILFRKDYIRLVSSGFLHNTWMHLIFNMIALYLFGSSLEPYIGGIKILLIYFVSLIGGNLTALLIHKNHGDYTSVGASGAVNGIMFSSIALFPTMGIGFFLLPISIPAWAFGLAYILFSIYGIKAKWGNSGHAAHLGGALIGMLVTIAFYPDVLRVNTLPILLITIPTIAFILLIVYRPTLLLTNSFSKNKERRSIDHDYNYRKAQEQADIDAILEKIHRKGMKSLTRQEKEALEHYSRMRK
ncbi:MAG: rhomboid family intramembrane serine protease [Chitinophagaceae bacterium]|nr:MAG: rhomboid family intramembrane serine protease [Chitinophagaceae bacterium]